MYIKFTPSMVRKYHILFSNILFTKNILASKSSSQFIFNRYWDKKILKYSFPKLRCQFECPSDSSSRRWNIKFIPLYSVTKFKIVSCISVSFEQTVKFAVRRKSGVTECFLKSRCERLIFSFHRLLRHRGIQRYPTKVLFGLRYAIRTRVTNNKEFVARVETYRISLPNKWKQCETHRLTEKSREDEEEAERKRETRMNIAWLFSSSDTTISNSQQQFYKRYFFMWLDSADLTQFNRFALVFFDGGENTTSGGDLASIKTRIKAIGWGNAGGNRLKYTADLLERNLLIVWVLTLF